MKVCTLKHPPAFIRLGCLPYIIVIGLLWGGGQGIFTALKNRKPLETTVAEYVATKPSAEWVTLKDSRLNLLEAVHKERHGKTSEVFIPVRSTAEPKDSKVHILLSTKDKGILAAVEDLNQSGGTMEGAVNAASRHADKLFIQKDVSGLIAFGFDSDSKTRDKLLGLEMNLTNDFVILKDGETPSLMTGVFLTGAGLLIGLFMVRRTAKGGTTPPPLPPNLPPKI